MDKHYIGHMAKKIAEDISLEGDLSLEAKIENSLTEFWQDIQAPIIISRDYVCRILNQCDWKPTQNQANAILHRIIDSIQSTDIESNLQALIIEDLAEEFSLEDLSEEESKNWDIGVPFYSKD